MNDGFNAKLIIDMCIKSGTQSSEGIQVISECLAHMLKFCNGTLAQRLDVIDAVCDGIKKAIIKNGENE